MSRTFLATGLAAALGLAGYAADAPKRACCAKSKTAVEASSPSVAKMKCSLTGKVVDRCCCVEREGKTRCTLAKKDMESCCCAPVKEKETE